MARRDASTHHAIGSVPLGPVQRYAVDDDGNLPTGLRRGIETLSGVSMAGVRVHYQSHRPLRLNAHAFAQGRDIHLGPGEDHHLPHEAWHIAQQARGRVRPTARFAGGGPDLNDDPALEREADVMGARAARSGAAAAPLSATIPPARPTMAPISTGQPVQRTIWKHDGKVWTVERESETEQDHGEPDKDAPGENTRYDQGTGTYFTQEEWLRDRLNRKGERAERRRRSGKGVMKRGGDRHDVDYSAKTKSRGTRDSYATPFGTAYAGRGKYNTQPLVGLEKEDWGDQDAKFPATNYDALTKLLGAKAQKPVLDHLDTFLNQRSDEAVGPTVTGLSQLESQAAAVLAGLMAIGEPHKERNPTGGAMERAAVRNAQAHGMRQTFNRTNGAYVPAWATVANAPKGGTGAMKEMRVGTRPLPNNTIAMLEDHLSASSADEASEDEDKVPARKARKRRGVATPDEPTAKRTRKTSPPVELNVGSDQNAPESEDEDEDEDDEDRASESNRDPPLRRSTRPATKSK